MIISTYDFEVNAEFENLEARYPQLVDTYFEMDLLFEGRFYVARVSKNMVFKDLDISIFNDAGELVQPKIGCFEGINLLYCIDNHYLHYFPLENKFEYGKL